MRWAEFALALVFGALSTAFYFLPRSWFQPAPVRPRAGVLVVVATMFYLHFVDDGRRPLAGTLQRMLVGSAVGVIVAAISSGSGALFALLALVGAMHGYVGFRWLKLVSLYPPTRP